MNSQDPIAESPKKLAFYSSSVAAWFNTQLERDRSLLTLSAGGIALLFTPLATARTSSATNFVCYLLAIVCFLTCVVTVLWIFRRNAFHIEQIELHDVMSD